MPLFETEQTLPAPRDDVFAFFADPANLEAITPPWLRFRILPPRPKRMRKGVLITYGLRLRGLPLWWGTLISHYDPPRRFVDRQLWGPYLLWVHTHTFDETDGGTLVRDSIRYAHAGGPLIDKWFVRPDLERIFAYRREALRRRFGG